MLINKARLLTESRFDHNIVVPSVDKDKYGFDGQKYAHTAMPLDNTASILFGSFLVPSGLTMMLSSPAIFSSLLIVLNSLRQSSRCACRYSIASSTAAISACISSLERDSCFMAYCSRFSSALSGAAFSSNCSFLNSSDR